MTASPIILDIEQGTQEWKEARAGFVTASRLADVMAVKVRGAGELADRANYRAELVVEILTGKPYERHITPEMRWGSATEPLARAAYEEKNGILVDRVGFVIHGDVARFGCSPDGYVGDRGMLQIKCPTTRNHLAWIRAGRIPFEHAPQLIGELACNPDRDWIDFVSFDPRLLDEDLQLFVRRYHRPTPALISGIEALAAAFNAEVDDEIERSTKGVA